MFDLDNISPCDDLLQLKVLLQSSRKRTAEVVLGKQRVVLLLAALTTLPPLLQENAAKRCIA